MIRTLALFGATGATGRQVLTLAAGRGIHVRALVRSPGTIAPAPGLTIVPGDACDPAAVAATIEGCDAIVCALGPRPGAPSDTISRATAHIVAAPHAAGVRRLVVVTGAMVGFPETRLGWMYRQIRRSLPEEQRKFLADRREQERIVRESGLDWSIVRPTRLTDGPATGRPLVSADLTVRALDAIARADLAAVLLDEAAPRGAVVATGPRLARPGLAWLAAGLEVFLGFGGLYGGLSMLADPSGVAIGFPPGMLSGSPFQDYVIPGAVLTVANGILPLVVATLALLGHRRAPLLVAASGAVLCGWIAFQLAFVGYVFALQPIFGVYGAVLLVLGVVWEA